MREMVLTYQNKCIVKIIHLGQSIPSCPYPYAVFHINICNNLLAGTNTMSGTLVNSLAHLFEIIIEKYDSRENNSSPVLTVL